MINEIVVKENIILICFDLHNELENFRKRINQINDNVIFYTEVKPCIDFIQSIQNQNVFLILTPSMQTISHFINLDQIHSIFMFYVDHSQNKYLFFENPKVVGVYDNIDSLCSCVQKQINFIGKQISTWCFFDQNEYLTSDLSKQSSNFLWLQLLHDVLLHLSYNDQAKKQMIETCRYYYQDNLEELLLIDEFEQEYNSKEAIRWFMKSSFLHKMINKALKTENTILLYRLRYFLVDLLENLTHKHRSNIHDENDNITAYREMTLSNDEFKQLQENKGKLISIKEFMIANTDRSQILSLLTSSKERTDFISVIFEIECNIKELGDNLIFADITQFNESSSGQQIILFDFNTTFLLENIQQNEQIWVIKLVAVNDGRTIKQKYIDDTHRQLDNLSIPIIFGKLIFDMSQWKQSQIYFEHLRQDSCDEDLAWIEHCIGQAHYEQGEWGKSREYYDRAYNRMMQNEPARIKDSAIVLSNIGDLLRRTGKYEKASDFDQRAITIRKKYYDSKHAHAAYSLINVGLHHLRERRYDEAVTLFKQALIIREEYYNCSHVDIAISLTLIGLVFTYQGKYEEALQYYQQAISIHEKYYPSGHVRIALILNSIGFILSNKKKYNEATDNVERALIMQKHFYPSGHADISISLYNIAYIKYGQEKYDESLELYQQALIVQKKYYFPSHLDIARTLNSMGIVLLHGKESYDEARRCHQQALIMLKSDYPSFTNRMAVTLQCIADISRKQMKNDEALDLYHQALQMQENYYLCDHSDMIVILRNIGNILESQGKCDEALAYHQRALTLCEKYLPPYHMDIVNGHKIIGNVRLKQMKFDEAFNHFQQALVTLEQYHPTNFPQIVSCLQFIANVLNRKSLHSDSAKYFERCLRISEASFPLGHSFIVCILSNLGIAQRALRQYELSLAYEMKCFSIQEKLLPPDHQDIGKILANIGYCYEQLNKLKISSEYYKQALIVYEQCLPVDHTDRQRIEAKLGQLCKKIEKTNI